MDISNVYQGLLCALDFYIFIKVQVFAVAHNLYIFFLSQILNSKIQSSSILNPNIDFMIMYT